MSCRYGWGFVNKNRNLVVDSVVFALRGSGIEGVGSLLAINVGPRGYIGVVGR